ncbi:VanZ family protein [Streptomyces sp. NPDC092296]|uniref:VanZ family protein n=1 Tax=Streptomyces sp. NPDC092296 TaxID=3366012 RepID=UPI0038122B44
MQRGGSRAWRRSRPVGTALPTGPPTKPPPERISQRSFERHPERGPERPRPWRLSLAGLVRALVMLVAFTAMVAFAAVLARLTLTPSPASVPLSHSNLHPGESLRLYLHQPSVRDAVKQIGGNLLLGLPFGVLLPVLFPRVRGPLRVLLVTAAVMLLVELVQGAVIVGRSFDVDDVILNTTGAVLGYLLLGRWISRAVHPPRRSRWRRGRAESDGS